MNDQDTNQDSPMNESLAEVKAGVKETVRETKDKLKTTTREVAMQAKERGEEYMRQGKERAAARLGGVSESIRQTADRFEREQDPNIARYTRLVADKLERTASYIRDHDLNQLRRDSEELARQHPAVFFGGMFVAGLAAARFLKASADRDYSSSEKFSGTEEEMAAAGTEAGNASDAPGI
jgi:hypothetical protein